MLRRIRENRKSHIEEQRLERMGAAGEERQLYEVSSGVRGLIEEGKYEEAEARITQALCRFPHSAVPHNLMGMLLENESRHIEAMKHFRAAWALDPAYAPARCNIDYFGGGRKEGRCAYTAADCPGFMDAGSSGSRYGFAI